MENLMIFDSKREDNLWQEADIVFDTCAICALYKMVPEVKGTMLSILDYFSNRIWLPAHVIYEYKKNRAEAIRVPLRNYDMPQFLNTEYINGFSNFMDNLSKNDNYHPYISSEKLDRLKELRKSIRDELREVKNIITSEFISRKAEISRILSDDELEKKILLFRHGAHYDYQKMVEIFKEGEFRVRNQIPPGYMDFSAKKGAQKYGDLIIWKQTIEYAKENNKSIIFITNDKKEDWIDDNKKPRIELLKEFSDCTKKDIWIYNLDQFITQLEKRYKEVPGFDFYTGLQRVKESLAYTSLILKRQERLRTVPHFNIQCDKCGNKFDVFKDELTLDWYSEDHRVYGIYERFDSCEEEIKCPFCEKIHKLEINSSYSSEIGDTFVAGYIDGEEITDVDWSRFAPVPVEYDDDIEDDFEIDIENFETE